MIASLPGRRRCARRADLGHYYDDEPFDVIVMSLSLHHMHPLEALLDRASAWFYDAGSLPTTGRRRAAVQGRRGRTAVAHRTGTNRGGNAPTYGLQVDGAKDVTKATIVA
ncbi:hypothetical protein ACFLIM_00905 [Nonomuraea sp. M3C6]|uniref:Methyltransferase domain-containing protein n=1 Tax=Nonomuraea marmarensis TaxID=3351344 RepID=A0ABW7A327_9ACTN